MLGCLLKDRAFYVELVPQTLIQPIFTHNSSSPIETLTNDSNTAFTIIIKSSNLILFRPKHHAVAAVAQATRVTPRSGLLHKLQTSSERYACCLRIVRPLELELQTADLFAELVRKQNRQQTPSHTELYEETIRVYREDDKQEDQQCDRHIEYKYY